VIFLKKAVVHNFLTAVLCVFVLTAAVLPFLITGNAGNTPLYGDVSGDFMITDHDVWMMQTIYIMHYNQDDRLSEFLSPLGMTYEQVVSRSDFNQDGVLDNEDISIMLKYLADVNYNHISFEEFLASLS